MRRHAPLVGWPRRDSRNCRFAMSNVVWEYKLNPIEFVILSYLCFCQSRNQAVTPAPETIAEASRYFDERGMKWNGNNLYTILSIRKAVEDYHRQQFRQLVESVALQRVKHTYCCRARRRCLFQQKGRTYPTSVVKSGAGSLRADFKDKVFGHFRG